MTAGVEPVGDVGEVHAGHELEQFAGDMLRAADAGRCHVELARIGLGVGDELNHGLGRHGRVDLHDERNGLDRCDRRDVADKVEVELLVQRDIDRVLRIDRQQGVAVGRHVGHGFGRNIAGGARTDLDDELLASFSERNCPNRRTTMSVALPAAWPTTIFTGRDG